MVANDPSIANRSPEILDNGATIMRRVVQIQNRDEDMGAMFIRHVLWEMFEKVGDGTATAGVLFRSIYNQGVRYITAGGNAMLLRGYLEEAGNAAINELKQMTGQLEGKRALSRLAETICYDPQLAKLMGEIFDVIGEYGRLEIRTSRRRELEREYIEGMYWDGGLYSREMLNDMVNVRAYLENAPILITDLDINEPQDVLPLLNMAVENNLSSLVLMGKTISDRVLGLLLSETNRKKIEVMAVKTPGITVDDQRWALQDLAVLTGGSPLHRAAGDQLTNVRPDDLGKIRRVWANLRSLVIIGGRGDARLLRQHITDLRKAHTNTKDPQIRKKYLERIGKLIGGSATLWIGDSSPLAVERRKEIAERTADAMRGALPRGCGSGGRLRLVSLPFYFTGKVRQY